MRLKTAVFKRVSSRRAERCHLDLTPRCNRFRLPTLVYINQDNLMKPVIAVVDDDISVRESLESLIRSVGMAVTVFTSAEEFLKSAHRSKAQCLILDVRLPGMNGFELQHELLVGSYRVPVVFMTAHGYDERARSKSASDWTVAYLTKPFGEDELLDAVRAALEWKPSAKN